MILNTKDEVLLILSKIEGVIFVGGTSEYLQGIKPELRDIDISVKNLECLSGIGYAHKSFDGSFYGLSGHRAVIPLKSVLIDVFIDNPPEFITVNGFKCETIQSMINLRENTLKFNSDQFAEIHRNKLADNLERLKCYILSKYEPF